MKLVRSAIDKACELARDANGIVAVEFAFILPVLMIILVMATDYVLSIIAMNQVEAAADAAAQYLLVYGWDGTTAGRQAIANAGTNAFSQPSPYNSPVIAPITIDPTSDIVFECATTSGNTYAFVGNYSTSTACAAGGYPFGAITARASYQPVFPAWWTGLTNGARPIAASVTTRFQ